MTESEVMRALDSAGYRSERLRNGRLVLVACKCGATVHRVLLPCHPLEIVKVLDYLAECVICGRLDDG
jgi:hypothetical protein